MKRMIEVCCGSYEDALQAHLGGADRIELNSALHLGGLTPSTGTLKLTKAAVSIPVIAMVRPRGAGFYYSEKEAEVMMAEAKELLEAGADGIAFGFLNEDGSLDVDRNQAMITLIHQYGKEAVFHRAFDCCKDPFTTMEQLIALGADRVLTSGLAAKAPEGSALIAQLQSRFGDQIEILAGSGVNATNARKLMDDTGIFQVHSSCKAWRKDPTTHINEKVTYAYATGEFADCYDLVSLDLVKELVNSI